MSEHSEPMGATEVIERRLRDALAQRADRTEPADDALDRIVAAAGTSHRDRRRRSAGLVAAAAVIVAVVAVAVAIAVSRPGPESVDITDDPGRTTTTVTTTSSSDPAPTSTSTTTPETTTAPGSTTTTTPSTTTTTPPTTTAPPTALPGASTDTASGSGTGTGIANLSDVRIGADEGYDRVVIELLDGRLPDWRVSYVDPPIVQDGSGEPVALAGDAFLLVTMTPASAYTVDGETVRPTYPGPDRIAGPGPQVVEVVQVGDYEAVASWAIGLRARTPFRVTTLTAPARLVIDIATP